MWSAYYLIVLIHRNVLGYLLLLFVVNFFLGLWWSQNMAAQICIRTSNGISSVSLDGRPYIDFRAKTSLRSLTWQSDRRVTSAETHGASRSLRCYTFPPRARFTARVCESCPGSMAPWLHNQWNLIELSYARY